MPVARILLQCCTSASLKVHNADIEEVSIAKGLIAYVSFLKTCSKEDIPKIVDTICNIRMLSGSERLCSLIELPGDLLIVPHFCLAGKLKQNAFQYHSAATKESSEMLYNSLVATCESFLLSFPSWSESCKLRYGTFAIRQDLSVESHGPFFHVVDV
ncbi:Ubiquitin protein 5 [Fasciolopsis buskii]|uniref:D-aminoacyl-tRNA deacylase n=1 Tax=Fasciolopsis buskii TaxID=27845 RepID=A0A8E0S4K1_9TREM|nr:Ubiquitin protein 5 [Fasciolopsis buski]